jgi:hypothetical protein
VVQEELFPTAQSTKSQASNHKHQITSTKSQAPNHKQAPMLEISE